MSPDCSTIKCGTCNVMIALKKSKAGTRLFSVRGLLVHWTTKGHQTTYNKKTKHGNGNDSPYVISQSKGRQSRKTKPGQSPEDKFALLTEFVKTSSGWVEDPESKKHIMCVHCAKDEMESPTSLVFAPDRGSGEVNRRTHMAKYHDGTTPTKAVKKRRIANRIRTTPTKPASSETKKTGMLLYMRASPEKRLRLDEDTGSGPLSDHDPAVGIHLLAHAEPHQSVLQYCPVSARGIDSFMNSCLQRPRWTTCSHRQHRHRP